MSNQALLMMVFTESIIAIITVYFFWKVLKTPPKQDSGSFSENKKD